ncbi:hypothetical protein D918_07618 [Trichuris suis]|nr:hypothetical protein D918_07618 [Trichuris suis]
MAENSLTTVVEQSPPLQAQSVSSSDRIVLESDGQIETEDITFPLKRAATKKADPYKKERPKRSLFCLTEKNRFRQLCIHIVEWK